MAAAKLTAPEVAVEHFAFGSKEEFYIEHLKFKKDAEDMRYARPRHARI
jgi:hypothetical protein